MRTETSAAPLIVFRIGFGLMMLAGIVRFWSYGWIRKLYLQPDFFFSYRCFEWVKPLGDWTYLLFAIAGVAAACITIGFRTRLAMVSFFLSFTYIELMDKTTYLNHYYFVSLLSFLLIWVPLPDGWGRRPASDGRHRVDRFYLYALRLFVGVVYFYAGLAKLNSDWLLDAQPLAIWLPARYHLPAIGGLLQERWVHFAFSWGGALYDLLIPFFLLWRPARPYAFALVVAFHVATWVLFPIGMFPWIMIVSALVFFDPPTHERILRGLERTVGRIPFPKPGIRSSPPPRAFGWGKVVIGALLLFHLVFPFRHLLQSEELFWTENGFRFSWRVMLIEKAGLATFNVRDGASDRREEVNNREFLSAFQEKQMATQPDFIVEYAHFLARTYRDRGFVDPAVYVDSFVALNGRSSRRYVNPAIDLTTVSPDDAPREYLLPFEETIYGF